MSNWGIGLGAFGQGFNQGRQISQAFREGKDRRKTKQAYDRSYQAAEQARDSDIAKKVGTTMQALPEGVETDASPLGKIVEGAATDYTVDGQNHGKDKAGATQAASKDVDSISDYYLRVGAPQMREELLAMGKVDEANTWDQWIQSEQTKTGLRHWASALRSAQLGDSDGFVKALQKAYNTPGYYEDGVEVTGTQAIKGQGGEIEGYELSFKLPSGETSTQRVGMDSLYQMGLGMLDPKTVFTTGLEQLQAAQALEGKDAVNQRQFAREQQGKERLEVLKAGLKSQQAQQEFDHKITTLEQAGYSPQFIDSVVPQLLGVDSEGIYKKGASPEEVARMLHQERLKDRRYAQKPPAEQQAIIRQDMQLINDAAGMLRDSAPARGKQPRQAATPDYAKPDARIVQQYGVDPFGQGR